MLTNTHNLDSYRREIEILHSFNNLTKYSNPIASFKKNLKKST